MKFNILFLLLLPGMCFSQNIDERLTKRLQSLIATHHGTVGIYVKNLNNNRIVAINADSLFPTASMIKVPILVGIMDKINRNELQYHQELIYHDSLLYPGVDILGSFKVGEKIELSKLMMLMATMSDNTASIWLQLLAGTGTRINTIMDSLGFRYTRVNSRTPGREAHRERFGWGQCTPREMSTLFEKIYKREIISPSISDRMLRTLNRNYWDDAGVSQIPPAATVFSKNGALNAYRSETLLVRGYKSEYVYTIITNNNRDTSWNPQNEAWELMRAVSSLLWNYFEPGHQWKSPAEAAKFY